MEHSVKCHVSAGPETTFCDSATHTHLDFSRGTKMEKFNHTVTTGTWPTAFPFDSCMRENALLLDL